jgi:hypothetical protein
MKPDFKTLTLTLLVALAAGAVLPARADERQALEQLRATTLALIEALVSQGLLPRERADTLIRQAAPPPSPSATPAWGTPLAAAGAASAPVVRVPYIPESLRQQITTDIRNEVLATARTDGWADARALPKWLGGITLGGDLRVRWQHEGFDEARYAADALGLCDIVGGNLPAACYRTQGASPAWSPDMANTSIDRDRLALRARVALEAKVSNDTQVALRLSTGSSSGPTSSSQTLGSGFNKLGVVIDRAWLRWEPRYDFRVLAGRMPNPFFGSDLLWPDDLGFDGVALQGDVDLRPGAYAFGTIGAFPLLEFSTDRNDKWLYALQVGSQWALGNNTQLRVGLGVYQFANLEGVRETQPAPTGALAGTTDYFSSQYPSALRLKGNTLINLNDPTSTAAPTWGLASKFRPINLTTQLTLRATDFVNVGINVDWVKNGAFDLADIRRRAGTDAVNDLAERTTGLQARLTVGTVALDTPGDWQLSAAWRQFERDAWVDGLTDTTWHGGGTNYQGFQIGGSYAFDSRTSLALRATSTRNLSDGQANLSSAPLKVEVLQVDLSSRF